MSTIQSMAAREGYSGFHKSLHWLMAVVVVGQLAMGILSEDVRGLMFWHKSTGILILALVLVRSASRLMGGTPKSGHTEGPAWQRRVALSTHLGLYACLLAMAMSGWMLSSAAGRPVSFYGLFDMPALVGADMGIRQAAYLVHDVFYKVLIGLICLHVGSALFHHFVKKDGTLKRMLP